MFEENEPKQKRGCAPIKMKKKEIQELDTEVLTHNVTADTDTMSTKDKIKAYWENMDNSDKYDHSL